MRVNNHLIAHSELLAILVEKIETAYPGDIALLICYGSYVTGSYGAMSDIDFFFVPKTERGVELSHQFILNNIGYDLWPVSWERLAAIATLEDPLASILMEGKMLFASAEADLQRLEDLKDNLVQNLNDQAAVRKMSRKYVDRAKAIYFDLQQHEGGRILVEAVNTAEALLTAIAILNHAYIKKGIKRIEEELRRFSLVPAGFLDAYRKLIRTSDPAQVQDILAWMIVETERIWRAHFGDQADPDPSELAGFYEEFKSAYNKLLAACDRLDYEEAYSAGFMIDRETQSFLQRHTGPGVFPGILQEVLKKDFKVMRVKCLAHEQQLVSLLKRNQIKVNEYGDMDEFRLSFLGSRTSSSPMKQQ